MHLRLECGQFLRQVQTVKCELKQAIYRDYVNRKCPECGHYPAFCWNDPELWCDRCKWTWKARGELFVVARYEFVDPESQKILEFMWHCFASE